MTAATESRRAWPVLALRGLIAAVLLVTGTAKLLDMPGFTAIVANYRAVPDALAAPAAWLVALGELVLAAWLVLGLALRWAAYASAALHAAYFTWAAIALARGLRLDNCGCFGVFWARPLGPVTLLEDATLVGLSLALARIAGRR